MITELNAITSFDWIVLITAGLIALLGLCGSYSQRSAMLFSLFAVVLGMQTFLVDIAWSNVEQTSYYYLLMLIIYTVFSCAFCFIKSLYLSATSMLIAIFFILPMGSSLMGIELLHYNIILGALWILQLIGALTGVLNGVRGVIGNLRNNIAISNN